jgi:hypothetical protein
MLKSDNCAVPVLEFVILNYVLSGTNAMPDSITGEPGNWIHFDQRLIVISESVGCEIV